MTDITCPALKGGKINSLQCKRLRADNIRLFGAMSKMATFGCPCDRKDEPMLEEKTILEPDGVVPASLVLPADKNPPALKTGFGRKPFKRVGTCPVCNRPNIRLYAFHGQDVCGTCKTVPYREKVKKGLALVNVAGNKDAIKGIYVDPPYGVPADVERIILTIVDQTDRDILSFIQTEAKLFRRTVEQQALWMLQSHLPENRGVVNEKT